MKAGEPRRTFTDTDGIHWDVRELKADYDRRTGASLIFESTHAIRRVRNYPADWHTLSEAELSTLSHNT